MRGSKLKKVIMFVVHSLLVLIMLLGFIFGVFGGAWGSLVIAVVVAFYFAVKWQRDHRKKEMSAS